MLFRSDNLAFHHIDDEFSDVRRMVGDPLVILADEREAGRSRSEERRVGKECLDAYVTRDAELARKVCRDDGFVDDLTGQLFRELVSFMLEDSGAITRATRLTFIGKYYERIADHATNIAELVVYMTIKRMPTPVIERMTIRVVAR